jgi:ribosomal protein S5
VIHATVKALKALRSVEQVAKTRGKSVSDFYQRPQTP